LFAQLGYFDDLAAQAETVAQNDDLCALPTNGMVNPDEIIEYRRKRFQYITGQLHEHQLLERKGRTYALRPSPLAVRIAEDWWRHCTTEKFLRIVPVLRDARLVESFCNQFQYLKHVEDARAIVQNLCDSFFQLAEVLNTLIGSRLFRSFVYVNRQACAAALPRAFRHSTTDELKAATEGRRNLVWALEKLCVIGNQQYTIFGK
jgi:hypothetical protein